MPWASVSPILDGPVWWSVPIMPTLGGKVSSRQLRLHNEDLSQVNKIKIRLKKVVFQGLCLRPQCTVGAMSFKVCLSAWKTF